MIGGDYCDDILADDKEVVIDNQIIITFRWSCVFQFKRYLFLDTQLSFCLPYPCVLQIVTVMIILNPKYC